MTGDAQQLIAHASAYDPAGSWLLIDFIGRSANCQGYEPLSGDYLRALYRMLAVIASGPGRYMLTSFCCGPE